MLAPMYLYVMYYLLSFATIFRQHQDSKSQGPFCEMSAWKKLQISMAAYKEMGIRLE